MRVPRDPERIAIVLKKIEEIWRRNPDLRLGQLIESCRGNSLDVFYIEDEILLVRLEEIYS